MTPKQRVLAALRRELVDYTPCCPKFNPLTPEQRVGKKWEFPWESVGAEMLAYCVEELGVDMTVAVPTAACVPTPEVSSRVWLDGAVLHKVYDTPAGRLQSSVTVDEKWPHGMDIPFFTDFNPAHATRFWIETEQDLECLRHVLGAPDVKRDREGARAGHEDAVELAARWELPTIAHIGMGLTGALQLFGPTELCIMTLEKPELVRAYLALEHEINLRRIEIACDLGVDIIRRNGFYETSDFYSPALLEDFLFDHLQAEIATAHEGGAVTAYTVHTGIMPMLDYLRRLDFDCLVDIDIAFGDTDLAAVRDSQEDTKSFWIGPSNTFHLLDPDPEVTREAVRECFRVFGKEGLIITPTPSAHSIMPWENSLAMIEEWRNLRG